AFRTQFISYFPNPDTIKKRVRPGAENTREENPYKPITAWFDKGNHLNLMFNNSDEEKIQLLYNVDGLHAMVKRFFPKASAKETALLMEFVLHRVSSFSMIRKKLLESTIEFKYLIGSMMNLGTHTYEDEEFDEEAYQI